MKINAGSLSPARNIDGLITAILGWIMILLMTRHDGIGVSPDSVTYLSVAANIRAHGGWIDFHGDPLIDFPVGYPLSLSAVMCLIPWNILQGGPMLNGFLFAALLYLCAGLLEEAPYRGRIYKRIMLILILLSPCLLEVYSMLWSETLFLPLLILFLISLRYYFQKPAWSRLALCGLLAGLATITRYAGITLIGLGGLYVLFDRSQKMKDKLTRLLLFSASAFILPFFNIVHNLLAGGTPIGHREQSLTSFGQNLRDFGAVICNWLHIPGEGGWLASLIGFACILLILGVWAIQRSKKKETGIGYGHLTTGFFLIYTVFILVSATVSRFQPLDSRLLSPLFIPFLVGSTCWISSGLSFLSARRRSIALVIMGVVALGFGLGQALTDKQTWEDVRDGGIPGYTDDDWRNSQMMDFAIKNRSRIHHGGGLYSNANDALWLLGHIHADLLPHKDSPAEIRSFLAQDSCYVFWFNDGINPDLIDIPFIKQHKPLTGVIGLDDGTVYIFSPPIHNLSTGSRPPVGRTP